MKRSMVILLAVLLVLVLATTFAACNKEHVHSDADGDEFCDDCGAFIGVPKSMEGSAFVQETVAKVGGLAERGAAVMANDAFTLGATAEVAVNGSVYTLRADVNVNGTDADANEFAVTLTHDGVTVLGVYLASRVFYIDDGTGVRAYDLFDGGSEGDLASLLGGLAGRAYEEGAVSGTIVDGASGFLAASAIRILSSGATATVRGNTGEVTIPLAVNIKKVIPLLGAIDLGFDISVLGDVIGKVLGASWEDLNDLDVELDPASTAQLTIRTKFDDTALTEVGLTYVLKETTVSLDIFDIVTEQGRRDILPATLTSAPAGGVRITGESMLGGEKVYTDVRASFSALDTEDVRLVMTVGSAPGLDDYLYAIYDGSAKVSLTTVTQDGKTNPNANPSTYGAFNVRVSGDFMSLVAADEIKAQGDLPGFKFYAALDLEELIAGISELLAGGGLAASDTENGDEPSEIDVSSLVSAIMGCLDIDGGIGLDIDKTALVNVLGAALGDGFDKDANFAATVDGLVTTVAEALGIRPVNTEAVREESDSFVPYYRTLSFVRAIAGDAVVGDLGLEELIDAMTLALTLGIRTEGGLGLTLGADLIVAAEGASPVSAGESTFTVGLCDAPDIPAAHARFSVKSTENAQGVYEAVMTGGIPDVAGEEYMEFFVSSSGNSTDALDFLLGLAFRALPVVFSYGLIG